MIVATFLRDNGKQGAAARQFVRVFGAFFFPLLFMSMVGGRSFAHEFSFTDVHIDLEGDRFQVDLTCDLDALALGVSPSVDSALLAQRLKEMDPAAFQQAEAKLRDHFLRRIRIKFGEVQATYDIAFPLHGAENTDPEAEPSVFGTIARFSGEIPADATEVVFRASRSFPPVRLTVTTRNRETGEPLVLGQGIPSDPIALDGPTLVAVHQVMWRYLVLGFEHILPKGLDHILFVLGLFLLSVRMRPLLWQVTAFTLAHTVTLGLSMYGVIALPSRITETLIALSIAYVAIENIVTRELKPHRLLLVFGFGLLHGLGFAGVLTELGIPSNRFAPALVSFNVGVELGQLAVILAAFLLVGRFREREWYHSRVVIPASLLIGLMGLYWVVERGIIG